MLRKINKIIAIVLCLCLLFEQTGFAQTAGTELNLSGFFSGLTPQSAQDKFRPVHLRYLSYDALNNNFKLLLDKGNQQGVTPQGTVPEEKFKSETKKLFNYFLIGLALPNEAFWVNLRPDSPQNIIDNDLEKTDIGKILLEADVQLKKDTANFTSPATAEGRKYWDSIYKKAEELFGYENITIPTLTRPWIVPGEIIIRESQDNAYIYKATLKVMLEQDYLKGSATYNFNDPRLKELNEYASQLIRELIIPKLTQEVNTAKRYAGLRQVYYSLILSQWFKQRFSAKAGKYLSLIDAKNLSGLTSQAAWDKQTYFKQYQDSFNKGEYNIQEPRTTPFGQVIRSYMSGGVTFGEIPATIQLGRINTQRNSSPIINTSFIQGATIGLDGSVILSEEASQLNPEGRVSSPVTEETVPGSVRPFHSNFKIMRDGGKGLFLGPLFSLLVSVSVFGQDKSVVINTANNITSTIQVGNQFKQYVWEGLREKIRASLKNVQGDYIKEFLNQIESFKFSKPVESHSFRIPIKDDGFITGYLELNVANNLKAAVGGGYPFDVKGESIYYSFKIVKFDNKGSEYFMGSIGKFYPSRSDWLYRISLSDFTQMISSGEFQNSMTPIASNGPLSIPALITSNLRQNNSARGLGASMGKYYGIYYNDNDAVLSIDSHPPANIAQIEREPYSDTVVVPPLNISVRLVGDKSGSTKSTLGKQKNAQIDIAKSFVKEGIFIEWVTSVTENSPLQKYDEDSINVYFNEAAGKTLIIEAVNRSLTAGDGGKKIIVLNSDCAEQDTSKNNWAPVPVEQLRPSFDGMVRNLEENDGYLIISVQDYLGHDGNKSNFLQLTDEYLENLPEGKVQRIYYQKSAPENVAKTVVGIIRTIDSVASKLIVPREITKDQVVVNIIDGGKIVYTANIAGDTLSNQTTVDEFRGYTPNSRILQFDDHTNEIIGLPTLAPGETMKRTVVFENQEIAMQSDTRENFYVLEDLSGTRTLDLPKQAAVLKGLMEIPGFSGLGLFGLRFQYLDKGDSLDMSTIYNNVGGGSNTSAKPVEQMLKIVLQRGVPATVYIISDILFNEGQTSISPDFVKKLIDAKIKVVLLLSTDAFDYVKNVVNSPNVNPEIISAFDNGFLADNTHSKYLLGLCAATNADFFHEMTDNSSAAKVIQRLSGQGEIRKFVPKEVYIDTYDKAGNILKKESYKVATGGDSSQKQEFVTGGNGGTIPPKVEPSKVELPKVGASSPVVQSEASTVAEGASFPVSISKKPQQQIASSSTVSSPISIKIRNLFSRNGRLNNQLLKAIKNGAPEEEVRIIFKKILGERFARVYDPQIEGLGVIYRNNPQFLQRYLEAGNNFDGLNTDYDLLFETEKIFREESKGYGEKLLNTILSGENTFNKRDRWYDIKGEFDIYKKFGDTGRAFSRFAPQVGIQKSDTETISLLLKFMEDNHIGLADMQKFLEKHEPLTGTYLLIRDIKQYPEITADFVRNNTYSFHSVKMVHDLLNDKQYTLLNELDDTTRRDAALVLVDVRPADRDILMKILSGIKEAAYKGGFSKGTQTPGYDTITKIMNENAHLFDPQAMMDLYISTWKDERKILESPGQEYSTRQNSRAQYRALFCDIFTHMGDRITPFLIESLDAYSGQESQFAGTDYKKAIIETLIEIPEMAAKKDILNSFNDILQGNDTDTKSYLLSAMVNKSKDSPYPYERFTQNLVEKDSRIFFGINKFMLDLNDNPTSSLAQSQITEALSFLESALESNNLDSEKVQSMFRQNVREALKTSNQAMLEVSLWSLARLQRVRGKSYDFAQAAYLEMSNDHEDIKLALKDEHSFDIVRQIAEAGFIPTASLTEFVRESSDPKQAIEKLNNINNDIKQGAFGKLNELDASTRKIYEDVEYTNFFKLANKQFDGKSSSLRAIYRNILSGTMAYNLIQSVEKDTAEMDYAAVEASETLGYIDSLNQKSKTEGRPLVVVANLSYGGFVLGFIENELQARGIKMIKTKIGSKESHDNPWVFKEDLFESNDLSYITQNKPNIFVIDGTQHLLDREGGNGKLARMPDAYQGYRNFALAVNLAIKIISKDGSKEWVKLLGLGENEAFVNHFGNDFNSLVSKIEKTTPNKADQEYYRLGFWNPAGLKLILRENRALKETVDVLKADQLQGPTVIIGNAVMPYENIPEPIRQLNSGVEHTPGYYDDTGIFARAFFERTNHGIGVKDWQSITEQAFARIQPLLTSSRQTRIGMEEKLREKGAAEVSSPITQQINAAEFKAPKLIIDKVKFVPKASLGKPVTIETVKASVEKPIENQQDLEVKESLNQIPASSPVTSEQKFIKLINSPQLGLINDPVFIRKWSESIKAEGAEAITIPPANYKKLLEVYGLKSSLSEEEFNRIIQAYPRVIIFDAQRMQELRKGDYNIMLARAERIIFHEKLHDGLFVSKTSSGQITDSVAREAMLYHFNKLPQVYREKLWNEFSDIATSKEWLADELVMNKLTFDKYPESTKNDNERDENEAELETRLNKLFQESEMQQFWNAIDTLMNLVVFAKASKTMDEITAKIDQSLNTSLTTSSPVKAETVNDKGGIDFRALPIVTQPVLGAVPLGRPEGALAGRVPVVTDVNLDQEWSEIQDMLKAGIIPSSERIKDYVQVCCANRAADTDIDKVLSCIAEILRLEEDRVQPTDPQLRELIVLLESGKPAEEMKLVLANISFAAKEPVLPGE